jgi:putative ABC transport system permease protein
MDRPGQVTGYVIEVDKLNTSVDGIKRRIEALEPGLSVVPTGEFVRGIAQMRVVRSMGWVVSCVAFFVGLIGVSNTMIMSVFERRGELGTLRALGWPALRIVRLVLAETLILSLAGALLGSVAGWLILQVLATVPATAGLIDGRLAPQVVGWGFALALGVGLCGAAYPAIWAARLSPLAAMRR